jgi:hypothetical protein
MTSFLRLHGVDPSKAAMFEDLSRNLVVPHKLGMTTVLIVPDGAKEVVREDWELEGRDDDHVDHVTDDLTGFLAALNARGRAGWTPARLDSPRPNPDKSSKKSPFTHDLPKEIAMSLTALESTINAAFDARDNVNACDQG